MIFSSALFKILALSKLLFAGKFVISLSKTRLHLRRLLSLFTLKQSTGELLDVAFLSVAVIVAACIPKNGAKTECLIP